MFASLDPALQAEVREQCERVSDDPAGMLTRPQHPFYGDEIYEYQYRSMYDEQLTMSLLFAALDLGARSAKLVAIAMRRDE